MKKTTFLILFYVLFNSSFCQAVTVAGLYEATVSISDKSAAAQSQGTRAALLKVLVKLTGKRNAATIYGVDSILKQPSRYLQQYEVKTLNQDEQENYFLWGKFDRAALQSAMREYSVPIWSQERPATLIWLVNNHQQGQEFANLNPDSFYSKTLNFQSASRGIQFIVPELDPTDRSIINEQDISNQRFNTIKTASNRYPADAILSVSMHSVGQNIWQVDWLSEIDGQVSRWETSASSVAEALSEGIDIHADKLAAVYSQQIGYAVESNFSITIQGINNFKDYAKTLNYLQAFNFIRQIDLKTLKDDHISYNLTADGNIATLEQAVRLGQTLRPLGDGQTFQLLP